MIGRPVTGFRVFGVVCNLLVLVHLLPCSVLDRFILRSRNILVLVLSASKKPQAVFGSLTPEVSILAALSIMMV